MGKNKKEKRKTFNEILAKTLARTSQNSIPSERKTVVHFGQTRAKEENN